MAFRSSASASQNTGGTGNLVATPAGVQAGDYLGGLFVQDGSPHTLNPPAGWTVRATLDLSGPDVQFARYADKVATGSDSFGFFTGDMNGAVLICAAWSGRDTSNPTTFITSTLNTSSNSSPISESASGGTAAGGDDLAVFSYVDTTAQTDNWTWSTISGFTQQATPAGDWAVANLQTKDALSAGATGAFASTITQTAGTGGAGWAAVAVAVKSVALLPTITSQPTQQACALGSTATFSVAATPSSGALSYQWYRSDPSPAGGNVPGTWSLISGATSSSYTTGAVSSADDGVFFYCVVTDSNGSVNSAVARLFLSGQGSTGLGAVGGALGLTSWAARRRSRGRLSGALLHSQSPGDALELSWGAWSGVLVSPAATTLTLSSSAVVPTWTGTSAGTSWSLSASAGGWSSSGVGSTPVSVLSTSSVTAGWGAGSATPISTLVALTPTTGWLGVSVTAPYVLSSGVGSCSSSGADASVPHLLCTSIASAGWAGQVATAQPINLTVGSAGASATDASFVQPLQASAVAAMSSGTDTLLTALLAAGQGQAQASGATTGMTLLAGTQPAVASWVGTSATNDHDVNSLPVGAGWAGLPITATQFLDTTASEALAGGQPFSTVQVLGANLGAAAWSGRLAQTPCLLGVPPVAIAWSGENVQTVPALGAQCGAWGWDAVQLGDSSPFEVAPVTFTWTAVAVGLTSVLTVAPVASRWVGVFTGRSVREAGLWLVPQRTSTYVLEAEVDIRPLYVLPHQPRVWIV